MELKIYTPVNDSNKLDYITILEGMIKGTLPNESEINFLYEGKKFTCSKNAMTINGQNVANVRQSLASLHSLLFFKLFTASCCTLFTTIFKIISNATSHYSSPIMYIKYCYPKTKHII